MHRVGSATMSRTAVRRDCMTLRQQSLDDLPPLVFGEIPTTDAALVIGRIGEHEIELFESEQSDDIDSFSRQRKSEYASGRRVAHEAIKLLAGEPQAVTRDGRLPVWPAAYCGSISHSREVAVALVASTGDCQGVGLDVVKKNAVSVKVGIRIMHPEEMHPSTGFTDTDWRAIVFSAKESVYKAVHPLIGEFLGFRDVEIKMNESDRSFAAATVKEGPSSKVVQAGVGFVTDFEGHWLTTFLV